MVEDGREVFLLNWVKATEVCAPGSNCALQRIAFVLTFDYDEEGKNSVQKGRTNLNVKDPEAHRLARAIARETGETITSAVTNALRERYDRLRRSRTKASVEELRAISERAALHVKRPYVDHAQLLYDEDGLPK